MKNKSGEYRFYKNQTKFFTENFIISKVDLYNKNIIFYFE
ncbi:hypothetical protein LEP1GSC188_2324 [Leptospira weilii serovar Topaz str. LT2116]|uniref:Uncharacterized protein n=1 Tax=Leptospira weilii serovar Topaz str. LT2116 TaxID=1088540 RepID=M3GXZ5_9LEPT|nr:hypothetical protein LEP1GSC188_2324 [Leptospira weilii serovar Topaz str. LT2116]